MFRVAGRLDALATDFLKNLSANRRFTTLKHRFTFTKRRFAFTKHRFTAPKLRFTNEFSKEFIPNPCITQKFSRKFENKAMVYGNKVQVCVRNATF